MKYIFIQIIFIKSLLFSSSDLNTTSLDMFLFKIGFTSLISEFENQKELTNNNTNAILQIKEQLQKILDTNSKNNISPTIKIHNVNEDDKNTIKELNKKIVVLEQKLNNITNKNIKSIKHIKKAKKIQKTKITYRYAKTSFDNVKVHYFPKGKSKITKLLKKSVLVKIQYCNKYQWCKVYKKHEYIAKIRLNF